MRNGQSILANSTQYDCSSKIPPSRRSYRAKTEVRDRLRIVSFLHHNLPRTPILSLLFEKNALAGKPTPMRDDSGLNEM